jgi:hypothetical protein
MDQPSRDKFTALLPHFPADTRERNFMFWALTLPTSSFVKSRRIAGQIVLGNIQRGSADDGCEMHRILNLRKSLIRDLAG